METKAKELTETSRKIVLKELLKAKDKKQMELGFIPRLKEMAKINQECVDVTDEVKAELASEHEVCEALHKMEIEALEVKISCLEEMIITNSVDLEGLK
tara:strand:+ start:218 stop:514 length:297 start_codon:yes stop_codon:yes gene_type:complete